MSVADSAIVNSFVQLSNFFGSRFDPPQDSITSLAELWEKHGTMMANMINCDRNTFQSSGIFYEVLYRKIRLVNAEMAASLDPKKAEESDVFEICKFYALFLEYLRKDYSGMLTEVLEKLAVQTGFNSSIVLEMFSFFDNLYSEDSVDNWWACLRSDDTIILEGLSTPKREYNTSTFATPTATARRLRTAASSARRSPIAEAVDSPTMKFLRSERELKQLKMKVIGMQQTIEDLDSDNGSLAEKNRELKLLIGELKGNVAGNRDTAENAEKHAGELSAALEAKQNEVAALTQQLESFRTLIRTEQRVLEELEAEKEVLTAKLETTSHDRDVCMKQLRELRNSNEQEFSSWRQKEQSYIEQLRAASSQKAEMADQLAAIADLKTSLTAECDRLTRAMEELELSCSRHQQDAENAQESLQKTREACDERLKMANDMIVRLQQTLEKDRAKKDELQGIVNEINAKALTKDKENHEKTEGILDVRSCLEAAKAKIERLELDVQNKESSIAIHTHQAARMKEVLDTELNIRENMSRQFDEKKKAIDEVLEKQSKKVEELEATIKSNSELSDKALQDLKTELRNKNEIIEELNKDKNNQEAECATLKERNYFLDCRLNLRDNSQVPQISSTRCSSSDSLSDIVDKENSGETKEKTMQVVSATPRKSVAFSVDTNFDTTMSADMTVKGNPLGFRTDMNNPRQSICSINEELFDRTSMARSSIRSDVTLASAHSSSGFKTPFTPSGTSKERVNVLTSRNEKVKPHLQCSYASEMGLVNSPSADEQNVKKGATIKAKNKRRESLASILSFKKK